MLTTIARLLRDERGGVEVGLAAAALAPVALAGTIGVVSFVDDQIDRIFFDRRFGVDTASGARGPGLGAEHGADGGSAYMPTPVRTIRSILAQLPIGTQEFVFVDFGAGKGRAMLVATEFPFKRVIGVERSPALVAVARRNIRAYANAAQQCFDIEARCTDAAAFEIPAEPCVLFFYNPFGRDVMSRVVANVRRTFEGNPRPLYVIYCHPRQSDLFAGLPFIRRIAPTGMNTDYFVVYEAAGP